MPDIVLVLPLYGATVHDNSGRLRVEVEASPALRAGERIAIVLDGKTVARTASTTADLSGVVRGTHELQARIVGPGGKVLQFSPAVTFYMWQASRLFPNRK